MKFDSILYVVDPELNNHVALQRAARLASHLGARLTVLYVIKPQPLERFAKFFATFDDDLEDEILHQTLQRHRLAALEAFIEATDTGIIPIEAKVKYGSIVTEINEEIAESGHDLLIKAADTSKSFSEQIFGTEDLQLLRSCPIPVWIKKAEDDDSEYRILAAVDLVHKGDKYGIEDEVLDVAHDLAKSESAELHVVHAWHSGLENGLLKHDDLKAWKGKSKLKQRVEKLYQDVHDEFNQLVGEHAERGVSTHAHLLEGEAEDVILKLIDKHDIDLLVIGSSKHSALAGIFMGSTAENLLNATPCSVLAIRPKPA